jgi:hypothetical protein
MSFRAKDTSEFEACTGRIESEPQRRIAIYRFAEQRLGVGGACRSRDSAARQQGHRYNTISTRRFREALDLDGRGTRVIDAMLREACFHQTGEQGCRQQAFMTDGGQTAIKQPRGSPRLAPSESQSDGGVDRGRLVLEADEEFVSLVEPALHHTELCKASGGMNATGFLAGFREVV